LSRFVDLIFKSAPVRAGAFPGPNGKIQISRNRVCGRAQTRNFFPALTSGKQRQPAGQKRPAAATRESRTSGGWWLKSDNAFIGFEAVHFHQQLVGVCYLSSWPAPRPARDGGRAAVDFID
jgi:hypothetical protein